MAGEGKFGLNIEAVYVHTESGPVPLLEYLQQHFGDGGEVTVSWDDVEGKPTTFAPESHNHGAGDVNSGTLAAARIPTLAQSKVDGLSAALESKADASALAALVSRVEALETEPEG